MGDDEIQYKFREMSREISNLKRKAGVAHDKRVIAEARSHENKMRAKTAEYGLRGLSQKYQRALQDCARKDELLRRWQSDSTEDYSLALDTERELKGKVYDPALRRSQPSGMVDGTIINMRSCPNCKEGWLSVEVSKP